MVRGESNGLGMCCQVGEPQGLSSVFERAKGTEARGELADAALYLDGDPTAVEFANDAGRIEYGHRAVASLGQGASGVDYFLEDGRPVEAGGDPLGQCNQ